MPVRNGFWGVCSAPAMPTPRGRATPAMLAQARKLQEQKGLANLSWEVGDVSALPFADAAFSVVLSRYAFHHLPNPGGRGGFWRVGGGRGPVSPQTTPNSPAGRHEQSFKISPPRLHPAFGSHLQACRQGKDFPTCRFDALATPTTPPHPLERWWWGCWLRAFFPTFPTSPVEVVGKARFPARVRSPI